MRVAALVYLALMLPLAACAQEKETQDVGVQAVSKKVQEQVNIRKAEELPEIYNQGDYEKLFGPEYKSFITSDSSHLAGEWSSLLSADGLSADGHLSVECQNKIWAHMLSEIKAEEGSDEATKLSGVNIPECGFYTSRKLTCTGVAQQGGAVLCQTTPNAKVKVARDEDDFYYENADENGRIIIGFDRDEKQNFIEAEGERVTFNLDARDYDISRIDGLPPSQVSSFNESQLKRIRSSSARKKKGFASRQTLLGFVNGFNLPIKAEFIKTTNFGAQRILNGEKKRPHYGVDLAAPVGTPIYAPADGVVSLADDDLYFEGAMVLLDHGQGLISMYLHTDTILVEEGQAVKQGEQIATVGSKGRSTGPHLCWRLKWRNRNLDPELLTQWPDHEH